MRFNLNTTRSPRDGFTRFTFSDPQQVKAPMLNEWGYLIDKAGTSGPGLFDMSAILANAGVVDGSTTGNSETFRMYTGSREYTWVICDGRLMGPHETNDFPIGSDSQELVTEWQDCEYAVIMDLECDVTIALPSPQMVQTYIAELVETTETDAELTAWVIHSSSVLSGYLDSLVAGGVELEGGDVWSYFTEFFKASYTLTLMRCPLSPATEETTVDLQPGATQQPRQRYSIAPLGMLIRDEMDDPEDFISGGDVVGAFTGFNPRAWLEGTSEYYPDGTDVPFMSDFRDAQYRAWAPYDRTEGVFLERYMDVVNMFLPSSHDAQDIQKIDIEGTEGYEATGIGPAFPGMVGARFHTMRCNFKGPIVISRNDPRPLVLHIAGNPIRINSGVVDSTGAAIHSFYRPPVLPLRWSIRGNLKVR